MYFPCVLCFIVLPRNVHEPVAFTVQPVDNQNVPEPATAAIFARGAIVLVTLNAPREKFWGVVQDLTATGLAVSGIDLNSFDDFARLVREGELVTAGAVFFPMHRVERIELDARNGSLPSLAERFAEKSGHQAAAVLDEFSAERRR
jgi:hypothetical protein